MQPKINTKKYEKVIEQVVIDNRETDRIEYAEEQYSPFNPIVRQLQYGDYIFKGYDGTRVCFEVKEEGDFLSSIGQGNNHLHNQVYGMIHNHDYCFVVVIVKDLEKLITKRFYQTGLSMSIQEINGVVSELSTVCTVLFSQTRFGAFDLMLRTAGKMIMDKPFLYKFGKKSTNTALNYLACIHGLDNKAADIVDTLGLRTKKDLDSLTVDDLCKVNGIGEITAMNILAEIGK
jgi:ERCC4-type nuclease